MSRVYVASSWRNGRQPAVVADLRQQGHEVYDFRHPKTGDDGFSWADVGLEVPFGTPGIPGSEGAVESDPYLAALAHPRAVEGFHSDFDAMKWADACVLVLPCGKSAHLELGWSAGAGKRTAIYLDGRDTPEFMYLVADLITADIRELRDWLRDGDR